MCERIKSPFLDYKMCTLQKVGSVDSKGLSVKNARHKFKTDDLMRIDTRIVNYAHRINTR